MDLKVFFSFFHSFKSKFFCVVPILVTYTNLSVEHKQKCKYNNPQTTSSYEDYCKVHGIL